MSKIKLQQVDNENVNKIIIDKLIIKENFQFPIDVCRNYCLVDLKNNQIPKYSILNNMYLYETPIVLQNLNVFEQFLIQFGKAFQTITKLDTLKKTTNLPKILALKGLTIHMPLCTENNLNLIKAKSMPNLDNMLIIIESLNKSLYTEIVDLFKVNDALNYLKENNKKYYSNIEIILNENNLNNPENIYKKFITTNESDELELVNENDNIDLEYQNRVQLPIIENYSIERLSYSIPNTTDIDKYKTKKNNNILFNDRDPDMDHLCFPIIFNKGTNKNSNFNLY